MPINALIANPVIANTGNYSAPILMQKSLERRNALPQGNNALSAAKTGNAIPAAEGNLAGMSESARRAYAALAAKYPNLKINSAYRSPQHNADVGGATKSEHMSGNAYDFDVSAMSRDERLALIRDAKAIGFQGVGVYNNALHFDVGPERAWGPDYHSGSLPDWARPAIYGG